MATNWGSVGSGAASGAATGAMVGSVVPGFGTAVGAIGGGLIGGGLGFLGGGGDDIQPLTPGQQYRDLFKAYGKSLPEYLGLAKENEPGFLEHQLGLQQKFGVPFAEQTRKEREAVNPEAFGALKQLSQTLQSRGNLMNLNMDPDMQRALQQDVRAGQFARGVARSPISATTEAMRTLGFRLQERDKWLNLAGGLANKVPFQSQGQVSSNRFGDLQAPQISQMSSLQSQANDIAFSQWDREQQSSNAGMGALLGGAGSLLSSGKLSGLFGAGTGSGSNIGSSFGNVNTVGSGYGSAGGGNQWGINPLSYGGR